MIISIIAAVAENGVIGREGRLPWHLPGDLAHFKRVTMGHPVIMGRKTHESIGRPLPGRTNIIITRTRDYRAGGCIVVHSLQEAFEACGDDQEAFIAGGASVYHEAMPLAGRIYLTRVRTVATGDALFPPIPPDFVEVSRETANDVYELEFIVLERRG